MQPNDHKCFYLRQSLACSKRALRLISISSQEISRSCTLKDRASTKWWSQLASVKTVPDGGGAGVKNTSAACSRPGTRCFTPHYFSTNNVKVTMVKKQGMFQHYYENSFDFVEFENGTLGTTRLVMLWYNWLRNPRAATPGTGFLLIGRVLYGAVADLFCIAFPPGTRMWSSLLSGIPKTVIAKGRDERSQELASKASGITQDSNLFCLCFRGQATRGHHLLVPRSQLLPIIRDSLEGSQHQITRVKMKTNK